MRHQEVPASEANALYPGIGPSCTGNNITVSSVHHMKDKPYLTKRRGCPSDTWTVNQATGTSTHVHKQTISNQFPSLGNSELNRSDECYTGRFCMTNVLYMCAPTANTFLVNGIVVGIKAKLCS